MKCFAIGVQCGNRKEQVRIRAKNSLPQWDSFCDILMDYLKRALFPLRQQQELSLPLTGGTADKGTSIWKYRLAQQKRTFINNK